MVATMTEAEADAIVEEVMAWGHMALPLPGWADRSTWGWDRRDGTFYAQLWRDGYAGDVPTMWLHPSNIVGWEGEIRDMRVLANVLVAATHCTHADAYRAMAASAPRALRPMLLAEIK